MKLRGFINKIVNICVLLLSQWTWCNGEETAMSYPEHFYKTKNSNVYIELKKLNTNLKELVLKNIFSICYYVFIVYLATPLSLTDFLLFVFVFLSIFPCRMVIFFFFEYF